MNKWVRSPMSRNKIPHSVKGIIRVATFFTLKSGKGKMHEDKVKFDQVNSATIVGVDHLERESSVKAEEMICWGKPLCVRSKARRL